MPDLDPEQTICFCHNVPYKTLLEAIRGGATTISAIQAATCASTGCGGCEAEVTEILEEELEKMGSKATSNVTGKVAGQSAS